MAELYYIHLEDPGFPDEPWPGERRLGPYLTWEEAYDQAVSDAAIGVGVAIGVYSEEESEKRKDGGGKAIRTRAQIAARGETQRKQIDGVRAKAIEEDKTAFEQMLPKGVTVESLLEAQQTVLQDLEKPR